MSDTTLPLPSPKSSPARYFAPGELIARRYVVMRCLGRGAAGTVYLCHEPSQPENLKAIKILSADLNQHLTLLERFYREGKVARSIQSQFVVRSYDLIMDDGVFAYSMEYVPGLSLGAMLFQQPKPELTFVCQALLEIGKGLCAIHEQGLVHRDLKPHNILVTEESHCKITDFGVVHLAKELELEKVGTSLLERICALWSSEKEASSHGLTGEGEIIGTVDYVSPEYVQLHQLDERSDIFSLGVVAFQMLVGRVPFDSGNLIDRLEARVKQAAPALKHLRPDVPLELSNLIMSCMERNPQHRPQSAQEYVMNLHDVLQVTGLKTS